MRNVLREGDHGAIFRARIKYKMMYGVIMKGLNSKDSLMKYATLLISCIFGKETTLQMTPLANISLSRFIFLREVIYASERRATS